MAHSVQPRPGGSCADTPGSVLCSLCCMGHLRPCCVPHGTQRAPASRLGGARAPKAGGVALRRQRLARRPSALKSQPGRWPGAAAPLQGFLLDIRVRVRVMVAKWPRRPTRSPWDDQAFFYWYVADKIEPVKLYAELYSPYVCAQRLQAGYDALATGVKARALLCTRRAGAACALAPSGAFPHRPSVRTRPFSSCEQRFCCVCSSQW